MKKINIRFWLPIILVMSSYPLRVTALNGISNLYFCQIAMNSMFKLSSFEEGSPVCITGEVSNVTKFNATISGQVYPGNFDINSASIGVILCKEGTPSKTNGSRYKIDNQSLNQNGTFSIVVNTLNPSTKYYYRTFFAVGSVYFYGEIKEFQTKSIGFSLGNPKVKNITCFSVNATCKIDLEGDTRISDVYSCGFYYSTDSAQVLDGKRKAAEYIGSDSCYTVSLKGLESNTTYYCVPYAARSIVYYYDIQGEQFSFTTQGDNIVETGDFDTSTNSVTSKFILRGGAFDTSSYGVCYSQKNTEPTISDPHVDTNVLDDENCFMVRLYPANGTTYYRAYILIDDIPRYGEIKNFNYNRDDCKEYVDLGLPSNILWATCNIGAKSPSEFGDYFAWGETEGYHSGKTDFDIEHYKFYDKEKAGFYKYATSISYWAGAGSYDDKRLLEPEDDAATVLWGAEWRMPTLDEIEELLTYCYWRYTSNYNSSGVSGYIVYKRLDRDEVEIDENAAFNTTCAGLYNLSCKHIFLPAAGCYIGRKLEIDGSDGYKLGRYWSSSLRTNQIDHYAYYLSMSNCIQSYYNVRYAGRSIRPVHVPITDECPAPQILFEQGKIKYSCSVPDVEFFGNIRCIDHKKTYTDEVELNATYEIFVYAKKNGKKSEITYAVLTWLRDEEANETSVESIKVPSTPILISGYNGNLTISNLEDNTEVSFYTTDGIQIATERVNSGVIHASLLNYKGKVVIIKAGNRSGKYLVK